MKKSITIAGSRPTYSDAFLRKSDRRSDRKRLILYKTIKLGLSSQEDASAILIYNKNTT
jgi:hypothetical protein